MSIAVDIAWYLVCLIWLIGVFTNKRTVRRMPGGALIVHVLILGLAFSLLMRPSFRVGLPGQRLLPDTDAVEWVGDVLQIAGLAFCVWARLHIGRNWSGTITLKAGHSLVRTGPYALVRHPIYTGLSVAILGKAIGHGQVGGMIAFLIVFFEWKRKSLMEERLMVEQFGAEYVQYRKDVKGLVPYVW